MVLATVGATRVKDARSTESGVNVSNPERLLSGVAGGVLALYGLKRRDWRGLTLALLGAELLRRGASGHCLVYSALGVSSADRDEHPPQRAPGELVSAAATVDARKSIKIERSISIARPREELFSMWRDFRRLPEYIEDLESVTPTGNGRSHWVARIPGDKRVEWDSEMVNEIPGELIAWKTVGDPDVKHAGSVHFTNAPGGRETEMRIVVDYEPPGGRAGALLAAFARTFGQEPDSKIREGLRQFKARVEES
jgi:uncharacterized membrane protein